MFCRICPHRRWQCFVKPLCLDSSKHQQPCDDPANNLSGFATSTSGSPPPLSRADGVGRYTTQDIHPRTILIVEVELTHDRRSRLVSSFRRQGWQCSAATSFERLQAIPFAQLSTFDVILVTNEFNKRCVSLQSNLESSIILDVFLSLICVLGTAGVSLRETKKW